MSNSGKKLPLMLAAGITLAVGLWMASGLFSDGESAATETAREAAVASGLQQVRIEQLNASAITREIVVSGRTEPNRVLELRAEAEGTVERLGSERGETLKAGSIIARLDMRGEQFPVLLSGGMIRRAEWLAAEVTRRLAEVAPRSTVAALEVEPALGAVRLALAEADGGIRIPPYLDAFRATTQ